jgi:hypothetical protein
MPVTRLARMLSLEGWDEGLGADHTTAGYTHVRRLKFTYEVNRRRRVATRHLRRRARPLPLPI